MINRNKIRIISIGSYLPPNIITNDDLSKVLDTNNEWIYQRTGILQRHIASINQSTADLAAEALKSALLTANIDVNELDGIILATSTPDLVWPATAIQVQNNIGMQQGFAFDLNAVCSGFLYGLYVAEKMLRYDKINRKIAVIGADITSRILDWNDRSTSVLFGDGAGAVILEAYEDNSEHNSIHNGDIIDIKISSDPRLQSCLYATRKNDCTVNMENISQFLDENITVSNNIAGVFMNGTTVFKNAVEQMTKMSEEILKANGLKTSDIKWILPHQANVRILDAVANKLLIPHNMVMKSIAECANSVAATIPITLDRYIKLGNEGGQKAQHGDVLLLMTAGAGMTFGSGLIRF